MHEDSYYREQARNIPRYRPSLEAILALKPTAVLRTWGGDARLVESLKNRGIDVIQIEDAADFSTARAELLRIGTRLGQPKKAGIEARRMDVAVAAISRQGRGRTVLYYTPSGYTAGPETWVGGVLKHMGYAVISSEDYYSYLSPELFVKLNPDVYALGFYEDKYAMRRVAGRHPLVRRKIASRETLVLPAPAIACNAWYSPVAVNESLKR
nr:ABC transporter substrate-binding protein [Asticcacaulis machinosus]